MSDLKNGAEVDAGLIPISDDEDDINDDDHGAIKIIDGDVNEKASPAESSQKNPLQIPGYADSKYFALETAYYDWKRLEVANFDRIAHVNSIEIFQHFFGRIDYNEQKAAEKQRQQENTLKNQKEEFLKKVMAKDTENRRLSEILKEKDAKIAELIKQNAKNANENDALKQLIGEERKQHEKDIDNWKSNAAQIQSTAKNDNDRFAAKINQCENDINAKNETILNLEELYTNARKHITQLRGNWTLFENKVKEMEQKFANSESQKALLESELAEAKASLSNVEAKLEESNNNFDGISAIIKLNDEIASLKAKEVVAQRLSEEFEEHKISMQHTLGILLSGSGRLMQLLRETTGSGIAMLKEMEEENAELSKKKQQISSELLFFKNFLNNGTERISREYAQFCCARAQHQQTLWKGESLNPERQQNSSTTSPSSSSISTPPVLEVNL